VYIDPSEHIARPISAFNWLRVLSNRRNWLKATTGMGFARIARIG
jgi:hypothetical protein